MTKVKSLVSRRRLIGAGLMIPLLVLAIWHFNTRSTSAQGGFESAIFTVTPTSASFLPAGATPTFVVPASVPVGGSFSVTGDITFKNERGQELPGSDGIPGQFYRSGVKTADGFSVVTDVYILRSSNGYITATGILKGSVLWALENDATQVTDLLAVTGGVGTFRSVVGEAQLTTLKVNETTGIFTVRLEEGLRRLGQFQGFRGMVE